jgi:hypothetical protein
MISGCLQEQESENKQIITSNDTFTDTQRDDAISIALNDREVQDYLQNGYILKDVGPLCYGRTLEDEKYYELCFIGVGFETRDVYLIVYVDLEKQIVNSTSTNYIRHPVIPSLNSTIDPSI